MLLTALLVAGLWVFATLEAVSATVLAMDPEADRARLPRHPRLGRNLSAPIVLQLQTAFGLAIRRVHSSPSCQALFEDYDASGVTLLARTEYEGSSDWQEANPPHPRYRVAKAMTSVGSRSTVLRESFASVSRSQAAITLIHEALHFAGMSEAPADQEGLTPREIDQLVAKACKL